MKTLNQLIKPTLFILSLSVTLFGCLKKLDDIPKASISGLSIVHASPIAEKLDVFINKTKVNNGDFGFANKIDYLNAYSGNRQILISKKGASTNLKSENFTLKPSEAYSLFVVEKLNNIGFLFLTDTLTTPPAGKAKIRFVNLSPDAGALNLAIEGVSEGFVSDRLFKEYSTFKLINPAERVTFIITNKTTGATEVTLANIKIEEGKIYTLWAKGLKAEINDFKLGASIFIHK